MGSEWLLNLSPEFMNSWFVKLMAGEADWDEPPEKQIRLGDGYRQAWEALSGVSGQLGPLMGRLDENSGVAVAGMVDVGSGVSVSLEELAQWCKSTADQHYLNAFERAKMMHAIEAALVACAAEVALGFVTLGPALGAVRQAMARAATRMAILRVIAKTAVRIAANRATAVAAPTVARSVAGGAGFGIAQGAVVNAYAQWRALGSADPHHRYGFDAGELAESMVFGAVEGGGGALAATGLLRIPQTRAVFGRMLEPTFSNALARHLSQVGGIVALGVAGEGIGGGVGAVAQAWYGNGYSLDGLSVGQILENVATSAGSGFLGAAAEGFGHIRHSRPGHRAPVPTVPAVPTIPAVPVVAATPAVSAAPVPAVVAAAATPTPWSTHPATDRIPTPPTAMADQSRGTVECFNRAGAQVNRITGSNAVSPLESGEVGARGAYPLAAQRATGGTFRDAGSFDDMEQRLLTMSPGATFLVVQQLKDPETHRITLDDTGPGSHAVTLSRTLGDLDEPATLTLYDTRTDTEHVYAPGNRPTEPILAPALANLAVLYDHNGTVMPMAGQAAIPVYPIAGIDDGNALQQLRDHTLLALRQEDSAVPAARLQNRVARIDALSDAIEAARARRQRAEAELTAVTGRNPRDSGRLSIPSASDMKDDRDRVRAELEQLLRQHGRTESVEDYRPDPVVDHPATIAGAQRWRELDTLARAVAVYRDRDRELTDLVRRAERLEQRAKAIHLSGTAEDRRRFEDMLDDDLQSLVVQLNEPGDAVLGRPSRTPVEVGRAGETSSAGGLPPQKDSATYRIGREWSAAKVRLTVAACLNPDPDASRILERIPPEVLEAATLLVTFGLKTSTDKHQIWFAASSMTDGVSGHVFRTRGTSPAMESLGRIAWDVESGSFSVRLSTDSKSIGRLEDWLPTQLVSLGKGVGPDSIRVTATEATQLAAHRRNGLGKFGTFGIDSRIDESAGKRRLRIWVARAWSARYPLEQPTAEVVRYDRTITLERTVPSESGPSQRQSPQGLDQTPILDPHGILGLAVVEETKQRIVDSLPQAPVGTAPGSWVAQLGASGNPTIERLWERGRLASIEPGSAEHQALAAQLELVDDWAWWQLRLELDRLRTEREYRDASGRDTVGPLFALLTALNQADPRFPVLNRWGGHDMPVARTTGSPDQVRAAMQTINDLYGRQVVALSFDDRTRQPGADLDEIEGTLNNPGERCGTVEDALSLFTGYPKVRRAIVGVQFADGAQVVKVWDGPPGGPVDEIDAAPAVGYVASADTVVLPAAWDGRIDHLRVWMFDENGALEPHLSDFPAEVLAGQRISRTTPATVVGAVRAHVDDADFRALRALGMVSDVRDAWLRQPPPADAREFAELRALVAELDEYRRSGAAEANRVEELAAVVEHRHEVLMLRASAQRLRDKARTVLTHIDSGLAEMVEPGARTSVGSVVERLQGQLRSIQQTVLGEPGVEALQPSREWNSVLDARYRLGVAIFDLQAYEQLTMVADGLARLDATTASAAVSDAEVFLGAVTAVERLHDAVSRARAAGFAGLGAYEATADFSDPAGMFADRSVFVNRLASALRAETTRTGQRNEAVDDLLAALRDMPSAAAAGARRAYLRALALDAATDVDRDTGPFPMHVDDSPGQAVAPRFEPVDAAGLRAAMRAVAGFHEVLQPRRISFGPTSGGAPVSAVFTESENGGLSLDRVTVRPDLGSEDAHAAVLHECASAFVSIVEYGAAEGSLSEYVIGALDRHYVEAIAPQTEAGSSAARDGADAWIRVQFGDQCFDRRGAFNDRAAVVESIVAAMSGGARDGHQILAALALAVHRSVKAGGDQLQLPGFPPPTPVLDRARAILRNQERLNLRPAIQYELATIRRLAEGASDGPDSQEVNTIRSMIGRLLEQQRQIPLGNENSYLQLVRALNLRDNLEYLLMPVDGGRTDDTSARQQAKQQTVDGLVNLYDPNGPRVRVEGLLHPDIAVRTVEQIAEAVRYAAALFPDVPLGRLRVGGVDGHQVADAQIVDSQVFITINVRDALYPHELMDRFLDRPDRFLQSGPGWWPNPWIAVIVHEMAHGKLFLGPLRGSARKAVLPRHADGAFATLVAAGQIPDDREAWESTQSGYSRKNSVEANAEAAVAVLAGSASWRSYEYAAHYRPLMGLPILGPDDVALFQRAERLGMWNPHLRDLADVREQVEIAEAAFASGKRIVFAAEGPPTVLPATAGTSFEADSGSAADGRAESLVARGLTDAIEAAANWQPVLRPEDVTIGRTPKGKPADVTIIREEDGRHRLGVLTVRPHLGSYANAHAAVVRELAHAFESLTVADHKEPAIPFVEPLLFNHYVTAVDPGIL
ncbi:MAG: hypothetical protein HOQ24_08490, partial [Mycobacteriaceae bacterium]|nr:hypothetical protein [Mycobacteriaceae bacterium]